MSQKIEIACPKCENSQQEPEMALSSHCRSCGTYLKIVGGVATDTSTPSSIPRFRQGATLDIPATEKVTTTWHPKNPLDSRAVRQIQCFDCDHVFGVPEMAQSSICSHCNTYINLENITVNGLCHREIKTLGDVELTRKSSAQGISINCKNLIAQGSLTGPINASGTVEIATKGKLKINHLRAKEFILGRRCHLLLIKPLEARKTVISGHLTGEIHCKGAVILTKTAHVNGDIYMKSIEVDPGAKHEGSVYSIQEPSASTEEERTPA